MKKAIALLLLLLCLAALSSALGETRVIEGGAYSLNAYGGKLYFLAEGGLYSLALDEKEAQLADAAIATDWGEMADRLAIHRLVPGPDALYGLNEMTMVLYRLDTHEEVLLLDGLTDDSIRDVLMDESRLIVLSYQRLHLFDLKAQSHTSFPAENLSTIAFYKDGLLLTAAQERAGLTFAYHLTALDPLTGTTQKLGTFPEGSRVAQVAYDAEKDSIYYLDNRQLKLWQGDKEAKALAPVAGGDEGKLLLVNSNFAAVGVDNRIVSVLPLDAAQAARIPQLVVAERFGRAEFYVDFIKAHGEIDFTFYQGDDSDTDALFVQQMITRSPDVDIFVLKDPNLLKTIKDKFYALDLSQSAVIKEKTQGMYPVYQAAFSENGRIVAVPKDLFLPMLSYSATAFEALGMIPPATYGAYFDFCLNWLKDPPTQDYWLHPFENNLSLAALLKAYADEMARSGKALNFQDDGLKQVLQKYLAAAAVRLPDRPRDAAPLFYTMDIPRKGFYEYLPLTFEAENAFVISATGDLSYYVVNPYSKNPGAAIAFLESYLANLLPFNRVILFAKEDQPVLSAYYLEAVANANKQLADLEARLTVTAPDDQRDIQNEMDAIRAYIDGFSGIDKWDFNAEDIATYQEYLPSVFFNPFNPISVLEKDDPDFFEAPLTNSGFDLNQFLKELDSRVQKLYAEQR